MNYQKIIKILFGVTISLDILLLLFLLIGFSLGLFGNYIGMFMLGVVFRFGLHISIASISIKLSIIIFHFIKHLDIDTLIFIVTVKSLYRLIIFETIIYGIYYIGKVMTAVG